MIPTLTRKLSLFVLLFLVCSPAFAAYQKIYNSDTGVGDFVGVDKIGDLTVVCAAGKIPKSSGAGVWTCENDDTSAGGGSVNVSSDGVSVVSAETVNFTTGFNTTNVGSIVTVSHDIATTTALGIASFDTSQFTVLPSGGVSITAGVYEPAGVAVADITDASANGRSLISAANYAAMRGLLDLEAGTDFNAYNTNLATLSAPGNWKVFYSDGSAAVQALALGANGTYLKSNGATSAPTFDTPGGGDITDVFNCSTGDCNNVTTASGDVLDVREAQFIMSSRDLVVPTVGSLRYIASRDSLAVFGGSNVAGKIPASKDVVVPLIRQADFTITQPDLLAAVSKDVAVMTVDSYNFPQGIVVTAFRLALSESASPRYKLREWTTPQGANGGTDISMDTIIVDSATEVTHTSFDSSTVNSGSYIVASLDSTNVNWVKGTLWFYPKS